MFNDIKILNNFAIFQKIKQLIFIIFLCSLIINLLMIAVSFYSMQIFDKVLNSSSLETLLYLTLLTIIFILFISFFCNLRVEIVLKINSIIQKKIFNNIEKISDVDKKINILQNLQKISAFFNNNFSVNIFEIILSIFYVIVIYLIHPSLAIYGFVALLLIIFFDNYHQKNSYYLQQNVQKKYEENSQTFLKINHGNIAFKINGITQNIFQKWRRKHKSLLNLEINYYKTHNKYLILSKNLRLLSQILSTMICAYLVIKNQISVGSIIAVSILLSKFLEPFSNFSNNLKNFKEFRENIRKIFEEIEDKNQHENHDLILLKSFKKIAFNKIFYRHQNNKNLIIQTNNICIYSNQMIAIIAKSDMEKSAIYNLLSKNYSPAFGNVEIDDFDLQNIAQNQLVNFIDLIENESILFEGNILENIAKMADNFSKENVIDFIKSFNFDCGISSLKNSYFSNINELNYGQKYWVCALRAMYHSPKILFIEKFNLSEKFQHFFDHLQGYKNSQNAIIFINNPPLEVLRQTDSVIIFKNGMANFFNTKDFINSNEKPAQLLI
jgi:ATP-binding cassette subfamily C protein